MLSGILGAADVDNLLIIGAGQLGSRHLQSLKKLSRDASIQVVEPNPASVARSRDRYAELPDNPRIASLEFVSSVGDVRGDIDLCIVATGADVRFGLTKQLIEKTGVRNILFEKVLFQRLEHYEAMRDLLDHGGVKAWVDCSMRYFPVYREIQSLVRDASGIEISVNGGSWGLASNAVHFLDLMVFFVGSTSYRLRGELVESELLPTKRDGFYDFRGILEAVFSDTKRVVLVEGRCPSAPYVVTIVTPEHYFVIDEFAGRLTSASSHSRWIVSDREVRNPYQSDITHRIAEHILDEGECWLPDYRTSMETHMPLMRGLLDLLGPGRQAVPIT